MRVGICAYWFNRGQGVVARQLRSALEGLGHETFVLARPTRKTNIRPDHIDREGVWAQEAITAGSDYLIPADEYLRWAEQSGIEAVFFDQNYQFEEVVKLRAAGVRTIGRFVWEHFSAEHVEPAQRAFETIYSLTTCEQERYAEMGIESPRVHWGIPPTLLQHSQEEDGTTAQGGGVETSAGGDEAPSGTQHDEPARQAKTTPDLRGVAPEGASIAPHQGDQSSTARQGEVTYLFPGGFMSKRKPLAAVIEAFRETTNPNLRLILKAQVDRRAKQVARMIRGGGRLGRADPRIELIQADLPTDEYLRMFAAADVCIAPSRWEGLGLHLYEATAFGVPIISNDNPPMNEIVADGVNGLLVPGVQTDVFPRSGIPAFDPDVPALTAAIERLADPGLRAELAAGARARREELSWNQTIVDLEALLASAGSEGDTVA